MRQELPQDRGGDCVIDHPTTVSLDTPAGPVTVDIKEGLDAYNAALYGTERQPSAECRCHEEFLRGKKISNVTEYWRYRQGELVLSELDSFLCRCCTDFTAAFRFDIWAP